MLDDTVSMPVLHSFDVTPHLRSGPGSMARRCRSLASTDASSCSTNLRRGGSVCYAAPCATIQSDFKTACSG